MIMCTLIFGFEIGPTIYLTLGVLGFGMDLDGMMELYDVAMGHELGQKHRSEM